MVHFNVTPVVRSNVISFLCCTVAYREDEEDIFGAEIEGRNCTNAYLIKLTIDTMIFNEVLLKGTSVFENFSLTVHDIEKNHEKIVSLMFCFCIMPLFLRG